MLSNLLLDVFDSQPIVADWDARFRLWVGLTSNVYILKDWNWVIGHVVDKWAECTGVQI